MGKLVAVTLPLEGDGWSPAQFAQVADKVILMAYDEHWQSGMAGPIASNDWFTQKVAAALKSMPADKAIPLGISSNGEGAIPVKTTGAGVQEQ